MEQRVVGQVEVVEAIGRFSRYRSAARSAATTEESGAGHLINHRQSVNRYLNSLA